jgi:hypothetical protein
MKIKYLFILYNNSTASSAAPTSSAVPVGPVGGGGGAIKLISRVSGIESYL